MGKLTRGLTRVLSNKNTMTILLVIAGIAVLFVAYNIRINAIVRPTTIPIATREIKATEQISMEDITFVEVNADFLKDNDIIDNRLLLDGKYINTGTSIPKGGVFHKSQVVEKTMLPNSVFDDIPEGYTGFSLSVDMESTYGNSMYPGDRIDLYIKFTDDAGKIQFGKIAESIEILAVKDSGQEDVFESTETGVSAFLLFAVDNDTHSLLKRATFISGLEIIPVPRNKAYTEEGGATKVENATIETYINYKTENAE